MRLMETIDLIAAVAVTRAKAPAYTSTTDLPFLAAALPDGEHTGEQEAGGGSKKS